MDVSVEKVAINYLKYIDFILLQKIHSKFHFSSHKHRMCGKNLLLHESKTNDF